MMDKKRMMNKEVRRKIEENKDQSRREWE